jgi:hypothetical protein
MKKVEVMKLDTGTKHTMTFVNKTPYGYQFYLDDKKSDVWFMPDNLIKKYFQKLTDK